MKEINISEKVSAFSVVTSPRRWLSCQEQHGASLKQFLSKHNSIKDKRLYQEKWGKGINPEAGAKGGGLFPVLCLLQDGRLACVMRTGMNHVGPGQLSISFSNDKGATWSPYQVIAEPEGFKDKRNGAFGQAQNGDLVVAYGINDEFREGFVSNYPENKSASESLANWYPLEVIRSSDGGKTWSKPEKISYDLGGLCLNPHGQMQRLHDDVLVFNARGSYMKKYRDKYPQLPLRANYLFRSSDNGGTWPKQTNIILGGTETGFLELDEQHWMAYARRNEAPSCLLHSYDRGHTWQDIEIPFPKDKRAKQMRRLPGQPVLLPNGKLIVVYGYRVAPFGVRAIVSHDGGKTFDHQTEYIITDSYFLPDCGYPSTRVFPDGTIVSVAYTMSDNAHEDWNTSCISYVYNQDVFAQV